jgi:hypothetical protein
MKLILALSLLAGSASFESLKQGATPLDRPASAVAVLVGACDTSDGTVSGECLENTKELKDKVAGRRVSIDLGSGYDKLLTFGGRPGGGKTRFVWGPLYDVGNGLALTVGKPQKVQAGGNVVVQKRPVDGTSPDELSDLDLQRLAATGMIGIQLVGRFGKTWTMSGPDKTVKGVSFEVEGMRLYNARTGATVFESTQALK